MGVKPKLQIETAEDWEELEEIVDQERKQGKECVAKDIADLRVVLCTDSPVNATIILMSLDEEEWEDEWEECEEETSGDGSVIVV